jgi:hypothetical protein
MDQANSNKEEAIELILTGQIPLEDPAPAGAERVASSAPPVSPLAPAKEDEAGGSIAGGDADESQVTLTVKFMSGGDAPEMVVPRSLPVKQLKVQIQALCSVPYAIKLFCNALAGDEPLSTLDMCEAGGTYEVFALEVADPLGGVDPTMLQTACRCLRVMTDVHTGARIDVIKLVGAALKNTLGGVLEPEECLGILTEHFPNFQDAPNSQALVEFVDICLFYFHESCTVPCFSFNFPALRQFAPHHVEACVSIARDVALGNDLECIFPVVTHSNGFGVQYYVLARGPEDFNGIVDRFTTRHLRDQLRPLGIKFDADAMSLDLNDADMQTLNRMVHRPPDSLVQAVQRLHPRFSPRGVQVLDPPAPAAPAAPAAPTAPDLDAHRRVYLDAFIDDCTEEERASMIERIKNIDAEEAAAAEGGASSAAAAPQPPVVQRPDDSDQDTPGGLVV